MKNAIIINGTIYELVPCDNDIDVCKTCDLYDLCCDFKYSLCVSIHNAEQEDHYIKRQKGGQS